MFTRSAGGRSELLPDSQTPPAARATGGVQEGAGDGGAPAAYSFGCVIIGKLSLRNGVTGRPSTLYRLHTGLSDQA